MKKTKKAEVKQPLHNIKWITDTSRVKLNYLAGINRPVSPGHVTKLAKSIENIGLVQPIVTAQLSFITGKPELYIIDGQHKFNALIRNNSPIPYVTIDVKDKQDLIEKIALLNASSKSWCMLDYITAWSSLNADYVKLNHYFQVYDMEIGIIGATLANLVVGSGDISRKIKSGTFKIVDESESIKILDHLTDVLKIIPRMNRFENKYVCGEYVKFHRTTKDYDHAKFLKNLDKNKELFVLATQQEGKLSELFYKLKK
jgi:hypothetical protein